MGKFDSVQWVKDQCIMKLPELSSFAQDLSEKTIVVIGANIGLGLATAKLFASLKPSRLILGCRTQEKGDAAVKEIQEGLGHSETTLEAWEVDMEKFKSVIDFADRYEREGNGRLDLLVMNAGMLPGRYSKGELGWETSYAHSLFPSLGDYDEPSALYNSIQVNHLGTSLLTLLLLPYIKNAPFSPPTPRIVLIGSESHYFVTFKKQATKPDILKALNEETSIGAMKERYYYTKLLNLFFTRSLAARLPSPSPENHNPVVTIVNPGWCKTGLLRNQKSTFRGRFLTFLSRFLARTPEEGGLVILWACLARLDGSLHGRFNVSFRIDEESDYALSPEGREAEKRIWDETISVLEKVDPRVKTIVREQLTDPEKIS